MALVDALGTSDSHEDVLGVVGHAYHFVRHDLADRKYEVERRVEQELVDLGRPAVIEPAFGNLVDIFGGHLSHCDNIIAPVVHPETVLRHMAEHGLDLLGSHRGMGAESRHHISESVTEIVIDHLGDRPGI